MHTIITSLLNRLSHYNLILVSLMSYILLYVIRDHSSINLYIIPGVLLLFYLPGRTILELNTKTAQWPLGVVGRAALAVFISVALVVTTQIFLVKYGVTQTSTVYPVLLLNAVLYLARTLQKRRKLKNEERFSTATTSVLAPRDLWPLFMVLLVLLTTILLSPYPADADGFLTALQRTVDCQCINSAFRPMFVSYQALVHMVLGMPIVMIFRLLFPLLFFVSTWFVYDLAVRRISVKRFAYLAYLMLLAIPVVLSEVNIIRPQVAMIAFTLPILVIAIEAWREQKIGYGLMAVWFAFLAVGFHELGIFLVLIASIPVVIMVIKSALTKRRITWQQVLWAVIIIYPYLHILSLETYFIRLNGIVALIKVLFPPIQWRWWFIDNYISIDGFNLGWPGVQSLYYYAYNGLLVLFFTISVLCWIWWMRQRVVLTQSVILPLTYTGIFLLFAEFMPRLGFFFLPNRAWVHLMLGLFVVVVLMYERALAHHAHTIVATLIPSALIIVGVIGTLYVAHNNVSEVFRSEIPAVRFVTSTSPNSLFLSSQDNHTLIKFYGHRKYGDVRFDRKIDSATFRQEIKLAIDALSVPKETVLPEVREEIKRYQNNVLISERTMVIKPREVVIQEPLYTSGVPVYFIYSLKKASGVNSTRAYLGESIDILNKDTYRTIGSETVYDDGSVIILKLR